MSSIWKLWTTSHLFSWYYLWTKKKKKSSPLQWLLSRLPMIKFTSPCTQIDVPCWYWGMGRNEDMTCKLSTSSVNTLEIALNSGQCSMTACNTHNHVVNGQFPHVEQYDKVNTVPWEGFLVLTGMTLWDKQFWVCCIGIHNYRPADVVDEHDEASSVMSICINREWTEEQSSWLEPKIDQLNGLGLEKMISPPLAHLLWAFLAKHETGKLQRAKSVTLYVLRWVRKMHTNSRVCKGEDEGEVRKEVDREKRSIHS